MSTRTLMKFLFGVSSVLKKLANFSLVYEFCIELPSRTDEISLWCEFISAESVAWYFSVSQFNVDVPNQKSPSLHAGLLDVKVETKLAAFT